MAQNTASQIRSEMIMPRKVASHAKQSFFEGLTWILNNLIANPIHSLYLTSLIISQFCKIIACDDKKMFE